jgi:hypothetical protein
VAATKTFYPFPSSQNLLQSQVRDVRRRCAVCYEKTRQQQQQHSREAGHAAAKKVKTFCPDCGKYYCLDCFNEKHQSLQ